MSYDLNFYQNKADKIYTWQNFTDYFNQRQHYELGDDIFYANEQTGVYFTFMQTGTEDSDVPHTCPIYFNLNFYRPHIFGLEAATELLEFITHFDLNVIDPQMDGMETGPFSVEGFLKGWNKGNLFGYKALLHQDKDATPHTLPGNELERIWKWNFEKEKLQNTLGENIFVPKIMYANVNNEIKTMVVWPDGIPIRIPEVDYIYVMKEDLAPRKLLRKKKENVLVPYATLLPWLKNHDTASHPLPHYCLDYSQTPHDLVEFLKKLSSEIQVNEVVATDQVLNEELLAICR